MLTLTKEEAVKRHRELWNKIAELCTGGFSNLPLCTANSVFEIQGMALNALGYHDYRDYPTNRCWACEYAIYNAIYFHRTNEDACCFCPLKWKTELCHDEGGEYYMCSRYIQDGNYEKAAEMARVIANLPEKED